MVSSLTLSLLQFLKLEQVPKESPYCPPSSLPALVSKPHTEGNLLSFQANDHRFLVLLPYMVLVQSLWGDYSLTLGSSVLVTH